MENRDKQLRVILNCMPPAHVHMPSPALNVLKSVLKQNQHVAEIIYWNIKFEQIHSDWTSLFTEDYSDLGRVLPFMYSLAKQHNDIETQKKIKSLLKIFSKSDESHKNGRKTKYFSELADKTHDQLTEYLIREFENIDFSDVLISGFTSKFFQWIPAVKVAELTKRLHPQIKTVIGGFDSKNSAVEMLKVFHCFDYAVWGEGEYPLLELTSALMDKKDDFSNISGLVYRKGNNIVYSEKRDRRFFDLNSYTDTDFDDFFKVSNENISKGEYLFYPIESNRGCNWNHCKFCVLGNSYKYRNRDTESVVTEIKTAIKKYGCSYFQFLDNNVLGSDRPRFEDLMDKLTKFFIENDEDFCFFAEIIPFGLDASFYKRLVLAGFRMVQIGGESFSDSLLRKMNKKNSFSDNLMAYKCCNKYGIRAIGSNILTGIPGENAKDVNECRTNIPFLRFFTGDQMIKFGESPFALEKLSKFYKELNSHEKDDYKTHVVYSLLPESIKEKMERFEFFSFKKQPGKHSILWKKFFKTLESYYQTPFSYKIFRFENVIIYEEFNNNVKIESLIFDQPEQWEILVMANNCLVSFSEMFETLNQKYRKITEPSLRKMLRQLKSKYLVFFDGDYNKIISIIDTDLIL